jgi:hypothetical protein
MALVPCPGCGRSVSDDAMSCPRCGPLMAVVPLAEPFEPIPPPRNLVHPRPERRAQGRSLNLRTVSVVVLVTLVVVAAGFGALLWLGVLR